MEEETLTEMARKGMEEEFNLSSKIFDADNPTLHVRFVKEFISRDWELFMLFLDDKISFLELVNRRLKLAGEELSK